MVTRWLIVGLFLTSCSKPNPNACCTSPDDCKAADLPSMTACGAGLFCDNHACVPASCTIDGDCPAEHPVCAGVCVDCDVTHACPSRTPVCDLPTNACLICGSDQDCSSFTATPHCDTNSGVCVACSDSSQCEGITPICDANSCRACRVDNDCETGACNDDGSCVPADAIVWITPNNGVGTGPCTQTSPCGSLVYAITQTSAARPHVVWTTAATTPLNVTIAPNLTTASELFLHAHGSSFTTGSGAQMSLIDTTLPLLIRDASFSGDAIPINARASLVTLDHVTIHDAKHLAVVGAVVANDLHVADSTDGTAAVIVSAGIDFTINGGVIHGRGPAISTASGSRVHLTNLLVYGSGPRPLELALALGEIQSSTIVGGFSNGSAPCTLACSVSLHVTSSIIWQPTCIGGSPQDATAACTFQSSIVSNASPPVGATNTDPVFVNQVTNDYHIQPTSPARDAVSTGPATDFEGDARPGGPAFDIGADEIP